MIFKIPFEKICHNPILFTVRNNDEIFRYRQNALKNIHIKILENINDEFIHLNPMKGLSLYDLPEAHTELGYEKPDERKLATQPFFTFYHHFIGLLTYSQQIPGTTDCILVDKDPYKRLQIETYMKAISIDKFVKVDAAKVQELGLNNSTVVIIERPKFYDDDGQQSFYKPKRAKILCNILQPSSTEISALFLDYGEISAVSISNIYTYEFKKDAPKFLSEIIPENKLPKTPQEGDIFVFALEKMKYVCVGRKSCNFNPEANPLDEVDTDTESVYFGPDATDDWENEEDSDGDDNIIDFKDVVSENNRISLILKENGLNLVNGQKESGIDDKGGADIFSSDDDSSDSE
uniref:Uncharacterized protein n=1 Tax=Panagrolaimus davidi TaxID=227884 RepID=A0A914P922_9BILA